MSDKETLFAPLAQKPSILPRDKNMANARLIAQAPTLKVENERLRTALVGLVDALDKIGVVDTEGDDGRDALDAIDVARQTLKATA